MKFSLYENRYKLLEGIEVYSVVHSYHEGRYVADEKELNCLHKAAEGEHWCN